MGHIADDVRVATFGGVSAFPILVAERLGLTVAHGLALVTTRTTDSSALRDDLLAGRIDVAHAAPDNAIAWADGVGGPTEKSVVAVWLAGSNGPIALVARVAGQVGDLRGARIGVDAPTSGFAPILLRLLATAGLAEGDVELVSLGATRERYAALVAGRVDASMLTPPWATLAIATGCRQLADHAAVAPGLLTSAGIVRRSWLEAESAVGQRYRTMLAGALAWLRDPASRDTATGWLAEDLAIEQSVARDVLMAMTDPGTGWPTSIDVTARSLDVSHALRASVGLRPARPAADYLVTA